MVPSYSSFILIFLFTWCYSTLITDGRLLISIERRDDLHGQNGEKHVETAFRPTTPGKSPGAGHSFTEQRVYKQSESEAVVYFTRIDPSSTEHGHSPGAGHSIRN